MWLRLHPGPQLLTPPRAQSAHIGSGDDTQKRLDRHQSGT